VSRRPPPRYASLTSLLDVLFILLFAALVQSAQLVAEADAGTAEATLGPVVAAPEPAPDAGVAEAAAPPAPLRQQALARVAESMSARRMVYARLSAGGALVAIEPEGAPAIELRVPLLYRVPDPDVGVAYLGDDNPALRVCAVVAAHLGLTDLGGQLVVMVPDRPLVELVVALVEGLRRDQERCLRDQGAPAVLLDAAGAPAEPLDAGGAP
jgi:hypothetical protein